MNKWLLTSSDINMDGNRKRESLWTQGNGYMGIRASFEEEYTEAVRNTLINGVFDSSRNEPAELAVFPDTTNLEIEIDGERFKMSRENTEDFSASLDMKTGEFKRSLVWITSEGKRIVLEFCRMVSLSRKHISAQKVKISPIDCDVKVRVISGVDGKVTNTGVQHFDNPQKRAYANGVRGMTLSTLQSGVDCAIHYMLKCSEEYADKTVIDRRSIYSHITFAIESGKSAIIEKISSYAHSRDLEYAEDSADIEKIINDGIVYLTDAYKIGYDRLQTESEEEWTRFWEGSLVDVKSNNDFLDQAVIFAQYHLNIMVSPDDNRLGVGGKALSGEGYGGHSFWDTEVFILPYYIANNPKAARRLLEYRYKLLDIAKAKAEEMGFQGAMYPWECAWITDGDVSNRFGDIDLETGARRQYYMYETEIHVTAGIAYAVNQYYKATGDTEFMELYGNEMLVLTALFWASRAEKKNGRYEILGVIGPDEYKEFVNNNAYTNYMAQLNLKLACEVLDNRDDRLCAKLIADGYDVDDIASKIAEVRDNLYLPAPEEDGIMLQFEGCKDLEEIDIDYYKSLGTVFTMFYDYGFARILKMQVFKQADLVMLFYLMSERFDKETMIKNFKYYEKRTLHDSSLSMCIHALVAARLGIYDMAEKLYYDACCVDLGEHTKNSDAGIHSASIGGIWLATVMGYGGLKITSSGILLDPILPAGWEEYSFFVCVNNTKVKVRVDKSGCEVKRVYGESVKVMLDGKWIEV